MKKSELREIIKKELLKERMLLTEGMTQHWDIKEDIPTKMWKEFTSEARKVIEKKKKIIKGPDGTGDPIINTKMVSFNGDAEKDNNYEPCTIYRKKGYGFCKTAGKPYNSTVKTILKLFVKHTAIVDITFE